MNFLILLTALLLTLTGDSLTADSSACGTWLPYKDEKCFWIVDDTTRTFADAEAACEKLDGSSSLVKIHTKEEQDFLSNYLFNVSKKLENFWLGAKVVSGKIGWIDNSVMGYANWDPKGPRNMSDYCVVMQADVSVVGKWLDEPCAKKSLVLCQRVQSWSVARLTQTLLDTRKRLEDIKEEADKKIDEANKQNAEQKHSIDEANKQIASLKQQQSSTTIPLGFIYTQLPSQQSPTEIWPTMTWTDISSTYAGVFWRVVGGESEEFGKTQADNGQGLVKVESGERPKGSDIQLDSSLTLNINTNSQHSKTSKWIFTGSLFRDFDSLEYLRFTTSTGEVRPRNMAIKVWRRSA